MKNKPCKKFCGEICDCGALEKYQEIMKPYVDPEDPFSKIEDDEDYAKNSYAAKLQSVNDSLIESSVTICHTCDLSCGTYIGIKQSDFCELCDPEYRVPATLNKIQYFFNIWIKVVENDKKDIDNLNS